MEEEKNDEKMALQSIYDSAFTEKIPGRGRVPCFQKKVFGRASTIPPLRKKFQVEGVR
jgi:hypothetical protein